MRRLVLGIGYQRGEQETVQREFTKIVVPGLLLLPNPTRQMLQQAIPQGRMEKRLLYKTIYIGQNWTIHNMGVPFVLSSRIH